MTHHITADRLVESATQAVTEELFRDFDNTLRTLCDEEDDRKAVFRTLRYARIRLHVLCGYISKEETPESDTQIRFLHIVIGYIDTELEILNRYGDTYPPKPPMCKRRWTGAVVELVELIYALHETKRIDDGETAMNELPDSSASCSESVLMREVFTTLIPTSNVARVKAAPIFSTNCANA